MLAAELADTYTAYREFGEKTAQAKYASRLIEVLNSTGNIQDIL